MISMSGVEVFTGKGLPRDWPPRHINGKERFVLVGAMEQYCQAASTGAADDE